ncbi:MAG TPA: glycoside hydrolase family 3 N-terminal domain-containing protein [Micromonosporaceae bacterium]
MNRARLTRRQMLAGVGLSAAAGVAGCGSSSHPQPTPTATAAASTPTPATGTPPSSTTAPTPTRSPAAFDEAALRRKIASLLVVGFRGESVDSGYWIVKAIKEQGLGGVILFDIDQLTKNRRNIASPGQAKSLITSLRNASSGRLIVSMDMEGGQIARLNPADGFPATKSEAQIGAANDPSETRSWASGMAKSMTSIGVNLDYAPVVDLNLNPHNPAIAELDRSFSSSVNVVVENATEEIKVMRAAGIKTSLKHFPGFGSATGNTDFGVVDVSKTWRLVELQPYQKLIAAGLADSILVTHLINAQLDPARLPASLSKPMITGELRGKLGYRGPVVSDDMQAHALTSKYGRAQATGMALEAGMDLLVYCNQQVYDPHIVDETLDTVVGLVRGKHLSEAQIDAAVARVDTLRPAR